MISRVCDTNLSYLSTCTAPGRAREYLVATALVCALLCPTCTMMYMYMHYMYLPQLPGRAPPGESYCAYPDYQRYTVYLPRLPCSSPTWGSHTLCLPRLPGSSPPREATLCAFQDYQVAHPRGSHTVYLPRLLDNSPPGGATHCTYPNY